MPQMNEFSWSFLNFFSLLLFFYSFLMIQNLKMFNFNNKPKLTFLYFKLQF